MEKKRQPRKRMKLVYDENGNILWDQVEIPRIEITEITYIPPREDSEPKDKK